MSEGSKKNIPDQKINKSIHKIKKKYMLHSLFLVLDKDFSFDMEYLFLIQGRRRREGVSKVGRGIGGWAALPDKTK